MRVTTRVRYGLRAMLQIAAAYPKGPVPISSISHTQAISAKYLEQLVGSLRRRNLLDSRKGVRGGYFLTRAPAEITLWEVIAALDGETELVECVTHPEQCERSGECCTRVIWSLLGHKLHEFWDGFTLQDLLDHLPAGVDGLAPCAQSLHEREAHKEMAH
jgi:Rrf2 family transcriptional regulator, cysteine metabolism repressor